MKSAFARTTDRLLAWLARPGGAVLLLAGAALLAYARSFAVPPLLDDWVTLEQNGQLLASGWGAWWPDPHTGVGGRPFAHATFLLNARWFGLSWPAFHAVNLLIHLAAGLALWGWLRRLLAAPVWRGRWHGRSEWLALVVAAVWMLHPLHVSSVTYLSQRTESLHGCLYLFCLYAGARHLASRRAGWAVAAVLAAWAGMASKEGMVTLPLVFWAVDALFLVGSWREAWRRRPALYAGLVASWLWLAWLMHDVAVRGVGGPTLGLDQILRSAGILVRYVSLVAWPWPLVFDYGNDWPAPAGFEVAAALLLLAAGAWAAWSVARRRPGGVGMAWFLVTIAPTSTVVPVLLQPMSENRAYLPSVGIVATVVLLLAAWSGRRAVLAGVLAAAALAVLTWARHAPFRDLISLWRDTVAKRPESSRAHHNLGHALLAAGRIPEAIAPLTRAVQLRPVYGEAYANLACATATLGDLDRAIEYARRGREQEPFNPQVAYALGLVLSERREFEAARVAVEDAVRMRPLHADARAQLGWLYLQLGAAAAALPHFEAALGLSPGKPAVLANYGTALAVVGRWAEAGRVLAAAVQAQPDHLDYRRNLAEALRQQGRAAEVVRCWEEAVAYHPASPVVEAELMRARTEAGSR